MASNRGPVEHGFDEQGRIRRRDAAGGVATALSNVARQEPVTWIASAATEADKAVSILGQEVKIGPDSNLRLINLPDSAFTAYYESFCNPILWFVQHSLADMLSERDLAAEAFDSWHDGYVPVNQAFAETIVDEIAGDGSDVRVMLHDYHLYLAPRIIRAARPMAALQHFIHIPWPGPAAWRHLPEAIVRRICAGLLANDSIVFQTEACVEAFLATCRAYLGDRALVLERQGSVEYLGQTTFVWSNPISVDAAELAGLRRSAALQDYRRALAAPEGMQTIVRVDRLDPAKNVADGFEAFDLLLRRHSNLRGKVRFLCFLIPSRAGISEYCNYTSRVLALADSINRRYATRDWLPVQIFYENNRTQALAALTLYDVLLVNSVADGMNLVSKEGPLLNERDGVLALSYTAGSFEELQHGAVRVNPFDIVDTATALYDALTMSAAERKTRATAIRDAIYGHQTSDWLRQQLKDLAISEHMKRI
ncbi:MAG TPA: trehalose-6-phosphate synthase, partial [Dehalococcoidia bacterium]|nr:trehalose-6-phosphate synthase [Dehalococcoidia bacterium]